MFLISMLLVTTFCTLSFLTTLVRICKQTNVQVVFSQVEELIDNDQQSYFKNDIHR